MEIRLISCAAVVALFAVLTASAQNLSLPANPDGSQQAAGASLPDRGMSMRDVEARFGSPVRRKSPVGDPPITRWEYDGFVVYFEYKHVIHSVRRR